MSLSKLKQKTKTLMRDALKEQMSGNEAPQYEKNYNEDERFWQPTVNKDGNAFCEIRFLPQKMDDDFDGLPTFFVDYREFAWKDKFTEQWYINRDRTSIPVQSRDAEGKPNDGIDRNDPAQKYYSTFWGPGTSKEDNDKGRALNRTHWRVANVLVVSDPNAPENNGKVFLYRYKNFIHKVLDAAQKPNEEDPDAVYVNPFDMWGGANLKLKISKDSEGRRQYTGTGFGPIKPVADTDEEIEEIYNQTHDLSDIIDIRHWRDFDYLQKRLNKVLGVDNTPEENEALSRTAEATPMHEVAAAKIRSEEYEEDVAESVPDEPVVEEPAADDPMSYFKKLAAGG